MQFYDSRKYKINRKTNAKQCRINPHRFAFVIGDSAIHALIFSLTCFSESSPSNAAGFTMYVGSGRLPLPLHSGVTSLSQPYSVSRFSTGLMSSTFLKLRQVSRIFLWLNSVRCARRILPSTDSAARTSLLYRKSDTFPVSPTPVPRDTLRRTYLPASGYSR